MADKELFIKIRHIFRLEEKLSEAEAHVYYSDRRLAMARDTDPVTFASWEEQVKNVDIFPAREETKRPANICM